jgi:hypothetical protein
MANWMNIITDRFSRSAGDSGGADEGPDDAAWAMVGSRFGVGCSRM